MVGRAALLVGLCTWGLACASEPPRKPPEEVPIGTYVPPPIDPLPGAASDGGGGDDAGVDAEGGVDAALAKSDDTAPAEPLTRHGKHKGRGGKPTNISPTSGGGGASSGGGGGDDRAALEAKVFGGHGNINDAVQLMRLCARDKDTNCIQKLRPYLQRTPH